MNATIQTASQHDQLSSDTTQKLERFQFLENSTGDMDKTNGVEKKKRPEDMTDSLAAMVSAIWLKQPNDIKAQFTNQCEQITKSNSFSSQDSRQELTQSDELNQPLIENSQLASTSDFTKNPTTKSAAIFSEDSPFVDIGLQSINEVSKPEHDNVSVAGNADTQASKISVEQSTSLGSSTNAAVYREQNMNRSGQNSDLRVTSSTSTGRQDLSQDNELSSVDMELSGPTTIPLKPDWTAKGDLPNSASTSDHHQFEKENEEAIDAAVSAPFIQQQFASPEVIPNTHPQQFGSDLKRSAEQARAAMAAQKGSIEGVKYSFNSWGAGDNSVQITGSSRSGYKAQASNGDVAAILGNHLSEDNSLGLTIESTTANGSPEDLNIQPGKKADQNNL